MRYFELYEMGNASDIKSKIKSLLAGTTNLNVFKNVANRVSAFLTNQNKEDKNTDKDEVTEDMSTIKTKLYKMIEKIEDPIELDSIYSLLQKDVILEQCKMLYLKKFGSTGRSQDRWFANLILNTKSSFEDKEKFLNELLANNGLFDGSALLRSKTGSFDSFVKTGNSVYIQLKTEVLKHRGQLGFGPDQGPMEIYLVLFGDGVSLATKGDLEIAGNIVEIKASQKSGSGVVGGRPVATSGYGTPAGLKDRFYDKLRKLGATDEFLEANSFNLNPKGFNNINQVIIDNSVKPAQTKELIDLIFKGLYTKMDDSLITRMYSSIKSDGTIDVARFLRELAVVQVIYYKEIEGFDSIMIANSDSTNYVLIDDAKDAEELYDTGKYKLSALISWNEARGGSAVTQMIVY